MRWRRFLVGALIGFLIIYWLRQWVRMAPEAAPGLRIKGVRVDLDTCCARVMGRKLKTVRLTAGPSARANDVSLDVEADASPERAPGSTIVLTPAVELPREPDDLTRLLASKGLAPRSATCWPRTASPPSLSSRRQAWSNCGPSSTGQGRASESPIRGRGLIRPCSRGTVTGRRSRRFRGR